MRVPIKSPFLRNPLTHSQHKRESFWLIAFPLGIGIILFLALGILASHFEGKNARVWADISLIFLSLPLMLLGILILATIISLIYGIYYLTRFVPPYAQRVQNVALLMKHHIHLGCDVAVKPILFIHSLTAAITLLLRSLGLLRHR